MLALSYLSMVLVALLSVTIISAGEGALEVEISNVTETSTSTCKITEYILALQDDCGFESIHGLWPDPESSCTSCTSEVFDEAKISSTTLANMNKYWPTCQSGTNHDFWSHEWSKHGTCTGMSQNSYFTEGISLYTSYKYKCSTDCHICFTPSFSYTGVC